MRRKLAAGNWKMNGTSASLAELEALLEAQGAATSEVLICPPATLVDRARSRVGERALAIGAQDCHGAVKGAHTGDVSAEMLVDAGASYVILGHSERRFQHNETNEQVREKAGTALGAGLKLIICVGETEAQRDAANITDIILGQMAGSIPDECTGENLVVAYEPVWAIGTGRTPTLDQIAEVHDYMRARLERRFGPGVGKSVRLLYGGSVNPKNAAEIFSIVNVDGALVGGASLKAADFSAIVTALDAA